MSHYPGTQNAIFWAENRLLEVSGSNVTIEWCDGKNVSLDIAIHGNPKLPHVLVSLPGPEPNLHAIYPSISLNVSQVMCMRRPKQLLLEEPFDFSKHVQFLMG
jgi:hypothetical protein